VEAAGAGLRSGGTGGAEPCPCRPPGTSQPRSRDPPGASPAPWAPLCWQARGPAEQGGGMGGHTPNTLHGETRVGLREGVRVLAQPFSWRASY